jgi:hypothetical protein
VGTSIDLPSIPESISSTGRAARAKAPYERKGKAMVSKAKSKSGAARPNNPNTLTVAEKEGKSRERKMAELSLSSVVANSNSARTFGKDTFGKPDLSESLSVITAMPTIKRPVRAPPRTRTEK